MGEAPENAGAARFEERDPWGRFLPGNQSCHTGGQKRMAQIRRAFLSCVTPLEVQAAYQAIFAGMIAGDPAHARLWCEYCLGKPKHVEEESGEEAAPMVIGPPEPMPRTA